MVQVQLRLESLVVLLSGLQVGYEKENPDAALASTGVLEKPTLSADALHRIFHTLGTDEHPMRRDNRIGNRGKLISPLPRGRIHHGLLPRYGFRWLRRLQIHGCKLHSL